MQTRGRRSPQNERVFATTSGNLEVLEEDIARTASEAVPGLLPAQIDELVKLVNWRITETRNPYLSWAEAQKAVQALVNAANATSDAVERVSSLGQNAVARPHGEKLLGYLDRDFNQTNVYQQTDWQTTSAWLRFVAANIEAQFVPYSGKSAPFREFIISVKNILVEGGVATSKGIGPLVALLTELDKLYPGLVYPSETSPSARTDYVRNALRK